MDFLAMQDLVLNLIGDTSTDERTKIKLYINMIKDMTIAEYLWPFQEISTTFTTSTTTNEKLINGTGGIATSGIDIISKIISPEDALDYFPQDVFDMKFPDNTSSSYYPTCYTIRDNKIVTGPGLPSSALVMIVRYFANLNDMINNTDTPGNWPSNHHHVLVLGAYWLALKATASSSEIMDAKNDFEQAKLNMFTKLMPRQRDKQIEVYDEETDTDDIVF